MAVTPSPQPFRPTPEQRESLFDALVDPSLCFSDIAKRFNTTLDALTLFITQPDNMQELSTFESASALRIRLVATNCLSKVIHRLAQHLDEANREADQNSRPPRSKPTRSKPSKPAAATTKPTAAPAHSSSASPISPPSPSTTAQLRGYPPVFNPSQTPHPRRPNLRLLQSASHPRNPRQTHPQHHQPQHSNPHSPPPSTPLRKPHYPNKPESNLLNQLNPPTTLDHPTLSFKPLNKPPSLQPPAVPLRSFPSPLHNVVLAARTERAPPRIRWPKQTLDLTYNFLMPDPTLQQEHPNAPPDKPAYRPFPEVAQAIRSQTDRILDEWRGRTLFSMPQLSALTVKEFENSIARILSAMADALESNDPPDLQRLMKTAPEHGFHRFMQDYDLTELFAEERVLRRVIVSRVEESLSRRLTADEAAALHAMIDIMLQQGVLALVQQQRQGLREGSEAQLKHLSFLSHDLSNTFLVMTWNLEFIKQELSKIPQMSEAAKTVAASLETIRRTRHGMHRLLEHEQLRKTNAKPGVLAVKLREIVDPIVTLATTDMSGRGPKIEVAIDDGATASTDADLVTIILQNLIGNAVKHSTGAAAAAKGAAIPQVRVTAERASEKEGDFWILSVADDGPGIPQDQLDSLFNAFERLPHPGEKAFANENGFGLGLAIASQAARLLGTTIDVKTKVGQGAKFSFRLPAVSARANG